MLAGLQYLSFQGMLGTLPTADKRFLLLSSPATTPVNGIYPATRIINPPHGSSMWPKLPVLG